MTPEKEKIIKEYEKEHLTLLYYRVGLTGGIVKLQQYREEITAKIVKLEKKIKELESGNKDDSC